MEIIHVTAELAPAAKVGGLGDVVHGLCRALLKKNHSVTILLPKYDTLDLRYVENLRVIDKDQYVHFDGKTHVNTLWHAEIDQIPVILIESHDANKFFERGTVYGCHDDIARFSFFCLSALQFIKNSNCDVVHLHDWHAALLAGMMKECQPEIKAKIIFTIHNLAYQGLCRAEDLDKVGWKNVQLKEGSIFSLLKGGIVFSDHVTTVSPNYAKEISTTELGGNLQPTLQHYCNKFSGILNGIDYAYWNPETDVHLPTHFSAHQPGNKASIKKELKKHLSLDMEHCPLVGVINRLVPQKGLELIKASILRTLEWGGQFVLIGSISDEKTKCQFDNLKRKLQPNAHVHLEFCYNEQLAHLLYAGADLIIIPSIFEPCGLTQLIAMRYGTVPLVRATGGLADTVFEGKNGFVFGPPTVEALNVALDRALDCWYHKPNLWRNLMLSCMQSKNSWDMPAEAYLKLYTTSKK